MLLRFASASPYVRKVRLVAAILGLDGAIELAPTDTNDPADPVRADNPLGKIPALTTGDGVLYDSRVIVEWLDARAGGGLVIPRAGPERFAVLTRAALAEGITDAALLGVYETRFRPPEGREPRWLDHQAGKVARGLAAFEDALEAGGLARLDAPGEGPCAPRPDVAQIGLACALGYLDLRFEGEWRMGHPGLVAWLDRFAAVVPAFEATRFTG